MAVLGWVGFYIILIVLFVVILFAMVLSVGCYYDGGTVAGCTIETLKGF